MGDNHIRRTIYPENQLRCSKCKIIKQINEFPIENSRLDKHSSWCKICVRQYNKIYREKNKEKIKQKVIQNKELYRPTIHRYLKNKREYYIKNFLTIIPTSRFIDGTYIRLNFNGFTILEHRHLIQKHLKRILYKWEHVHHINGNRLDNRLENLTVVDKKIHWVITNLEQENKLLREELKKYQERENVSNR